MIAKGTLERASTWLAKAEADYQEAESRNDHLAMAKSLDSLLRAKISITEGDARQRLVIARAKLVLKVPQAAPSYRPPESMAKAFVPAQPDFENDLDRVERDYRPRPTREQAERDRDFAISVSLVRARQRLAKCVAVGDHLGSLNALNCELVAEQALAKSDADRQHFRQLRSQVHETAVGAGFEIGPSGIYRMAKASVAATNTAKQLDSMYQNLSQALDRVTGAGLRQKVEALRNEVVAMAQGMGCRLKNGSFVHYAS